MPAPLMSREEIVARLLEIFRERGYDGASLSDVSAATGLGKSSLYHHFPGGKQDMGAAVLEQAGVWLERDIVGALSAERPPLRRLDAMFAAVRSFYGGGTRPCILGALVTGSARKVFQPELTQRFRRWMQALAGMLTEAGVASATARELAEDLVVSVQGALIVSRGTDDADVFGDTLRRQQARLKAALEAVQR
ncbi:TetR family transcriptional regulator [Myxococcus stipitatus DSM 14675]|uniref:TetR family transcriptional regulator n=1 Tax=Myxococcus stipitatus (strain DSM 14675 / JCM 12634 / Mx s8) TaxID=1278073 RepID=L7U563_MYXSD|nr:TetR/AcrR family transcriptional regulator [Myxococcus stipitatus]AGC42950.1 TetR family transcriptional regulator [Myxococcus stipitatus DSM 14675]